MTNSPNNPPKGNDAADGQGKRRRKAGSNLVPADAQPSFGNANEVGSRLKQFIIATKPAPGLTPMAVDALQGQLESLPDITVVRRVRPGIVAAMGLGGGSTIGDMIVAETTAERGAELQATAGPNVIIEENRELTHLALSPLFDARAGSQNILPVTQAVQVQVLDENGNPLKKAQIIVYGRNWPVQAETDDTGAATLELRGGTTQSLQFMYVKPFGDNWERWIETPSLSADAPNIVRLKPLSSYKGAGFTGDAFVGWGQKEMGLTLQSPFTGAGARIGIVDSGCDNHHPALTHVTTGLDYTNKNPNDEPDAQSWATDSLGHGTHCAGVITGNGQGGIRGFAPEAEIHILKLFPGGFFDDLSRALKYAIDRKLDVVNCSLGSPEPSEAVRQWMNLARQAGVAVVVAAGNSAPDPVQFPASIPEALAVGAVGQQKTFPDDTYHAQTVPFGTIGVNGTFPAKFSCSGPQVRIAGPGVAIISSVPGGGYAAWDGTSMAAPHITGMIALLAAHHPDFADRRAPRDASRVDRLIALAVASATALNLDAQHVGAGLPSLVAAMNASPSPRNAAVPAVNPDEVKRIIDIVMAQLQR